MRVISCRNFRKTWLRKQSLTPIAGLVILLFLLLMIQSNNGVDNDEEDEEVICDELFARDGKTMKSYLRPESDTAIIVPKFSNATLNDERKMVASFVISSPENIEARQMIRETWGSIIKPLFIIGRNENQEKFKDDIKREAAEFDDIILEDFIDSYENLTIKTGFALKNFIRYFNDSTYFMKVDEDVTMNTKKLYETINSAPGDSLIGAWTNITPVIRDVDNKWFMPKCQYQKEFYPQYLQGALYLIPGNRLKAFNIFIQSRDD